MKFIAGAALASLLSMAPMAIGAQANKPAPSVTAGNSSAEPRVASDMLTKTVHEVWVDSGRDENKFFDVVKSMAEMSAHKRGVSLPDTEATGRQLGTLIKASARRDPDQLLYAVVDAAVRQIAGGSAHVKPVAK